MVFGDSAISPVTKITDGQYKIQTVDCRLGIRCRLSVKLYAYQKTNLNLNVISPLSLLAGINKRAPRLVCGEGEGEFLLRLEVL